jgi:small subunit ribosomal protein S3
MTADIIAGPAIITWGGQSLYSQGDINVRKVQGSWNPQSSIFGTIGKRSSGLDTLRQGLQQITSSDVYPNIIEVRKVELDAVLVAQNVAQQLEKRVSFRRAMKKAMTSARRAGAKGVKIMCSGRLGGAEMSRCEWYMEGRVPLHTLRAEIDFGKAEAHTTYGAIGVKVWIFKGEILGGESQAS